MDSKTLQSKVNFKMLKRDYKPCPKLAGGCEEMGDGVSGGETAEEGGVAAPLRLTLADGPLGPCDPLPPFPAAEVNELMR